MISFKGVACLATLIQLSISRSISSTPASAGSSKGASTQVTAAPSSTSSSSQDAISPSDLLNDTLANDLLIALAFFVTAVFVYRTVLRILQHVRHVTSLTNNSQRYFSVPDPTWASIKKNILYAPLFRVRHNEEFRLSSALDLGTLPTRFQTMFMVAIVATNITLCVYATPWHSPEKAVLPILRNRTGTLATVNLIPMVIMTGRNNPLIGWLNVSYDSFNMMHRLFGRIVTIEALAHTLAWMIAKVQESKSARALSREDHANHNSSRVESGSRRTR